MSAVFNLIARTAAACGVKTNYAISWRNFDPARESRADGVFLVIPWLREKDYPALREHLAAVAGTTDSKKINIVSITRIGR